jgi:hypothetical protein
MGRLG